MKLPNRYKILKDSKDGGYYLIRIGLKGYSMYYTLASLIDIFYHPSFDENNLYKGHPLPPSYEFLYYQIYQLPCIVSFDRRTTKEALKKKLVEYLI